MTEPVFSRPTSSPFFEKNDVVLKVMLPERMNDDVKRAAREHGYGSTSEFVRDWLAVKLYGERHVLNVHEHRVAMLARNMAANGAGSEPGGAS